MTIHRREFGRRLGRAALALGSLGLTKSLVSCVSPRDDATGEDPTGGDSTEGRALPIIDTHQHLWDLTRLRPPWLRAAPAVLSRSYVTADYLEASEGLDVVKAVYMEVDVSPDDQVAEAEHVIELSKSDDHPTVAAVISGRPASEAFRPYIERFAASPYIKGVRQVLHVPEAKRGLCLEDEFVRSMRLLGDLGKSFDLCMRPMELTDGVELARRCPDTRFIIDHCGNADPKAWRPAGTLGDLGDEEPWHRVDQWKRDMAAFARLDNVVCKISGIIARAPKDDWTPDDLAPIVDFCLEEFGPDRVVFGSDWPVCNVVASYREWVSALREIVSSRARAEQEKLFGANAARLYRLS